MSSLLVDLGGTDLKFGISDESKLQFKHFRRIPTPSLKASNSYRREIDTSSLVSLLLTWINRYLSQFKEIERILISGQMGCWVVGDAESFPKSVISWQDLRSIEKYGTRENAVHKFDLNEVLIRNGREIEPGVPLLGLLTFLDEVKATEKLRFRSLITLVLEALIGKPSEFMHITDAASSGIINMRTREWDDYVCSNLLHQVNLPVVTQDVIPVGNLIGRDIKVYVGVGDQQASLLGVGISESNVVLNIGTGGQVATIGEFKTKFPVKLRPFFDQKTILTYTHLLSGRFLNLVLDTASHVYQRTFTHDDFNKELEFLSKSTFEYELKECLNKDYLLTMAKELNSIDFLNSAIETMSNQYVKAVEAIGGSDNKQIIFAGGVGQRNLLLTSRIASKLRQSNFLISKAEETTLAGLTKLNDSIVNSNH